MDMLQRDYIVQSSGLKKETGEPYAILNRVITTKSGSFVSDGDRLFLDEVLTVGSVVKYEMMRVD